MKCYNHHDRDAMGIDIITGKGLCLECLEEYKGHIIEKNNQYSHKRVDDINNVYGQLDNGKKYAKSLKIVMVTIGAIVIATSINTLIMGNFDLILAFLGVLFLIMGLSIKPTKKQ